MLKSIQEIQSIGLPAFLDKYHINAKRHSKYSNLVLLKYDQIESPKGIEAVEECRGLILDEADNFKPISYPYRRFYNHGDFYAANLDWSSAQVYEKFDGSLCTVYYYDDKWHVATSGTPDAQGQVHNDNSLTFEQLFWQTWTDLGYVMPIDTNFVYIFELMTSQNVILVRHKESRIVLHGMRNMQTLDEWPIHPLSLELNWEVAKVYSLTNIDQIMQSLVNVDPSQQEGYVVVDEKFNRLKVKSPQYVALSHLKDGLTGKTRILEIVRNNENSEFLAYFPEYKEQFEDLSKKYQIFKDKIQQTWDSLDKTLSGKEFALQVNQLPYSSVFFMLKSGKIKTISDWLKEVKIDYLAKYIQ